MNPEEGKTEVGGSEAKERPELRRTISPTLLRPTPMELGKIKIGGKGEERQKKSGKGTWRQPVKYDHFLVTTMKREEDGNLQVDAAIHRDLGAEPEALDVVLMFDDLEDNFQSEMLVYDGKTKVFACDGERAFNYQKGKSGPCQRDTEKGCRCKPFGRLAVILEAASQYGGFHLFRTTSWKTINNLQTTLRLFQAQFEGSLRGLPLRLVIYPSTDQHEGGTSTNYKVGIVLRHSYEEVRQAMLVYHQADRTERHELKLLAAGVLRELDEKEVEDGRDIADEFLVDPLLRDEIKEIQEREVAREATEATTAALASRVQADNGHTPTAEVEEPPKEEGPLPDWSEGEEEVGEVVPILHRLVEFGKYGPKGEKAPKGEARTWGYVFSELEGPGYVKHFVLNHEHPSLTKEVKDLLQGALDDHEEEKRVRREERAEKDEEEKNGGDGKEEAPEPSEDELEALSDLYDGAQEIATDLAKLDELMPTEAEELDLLRDEKDKEGLRKLRSKLGARLEKLIAGGADPQLRF